MSDRIVQIELRNIGSIREMVKDLPDTNIIWFTGGNGGMKTLALKALFAAAAGAAKLSTDFITKGEDEGYLAFTFESGNKLERILIPGKPQVLKYTLHGRKRPETGPQKMLDDLFGKSCLDPWRFKNYKPSERVNSLGQLFGLTEKLQIIADNEKYAREDRTDTYRELKRLKGSLDSMLKPDPDTPLEEIKVADALEEIQKAEKHNLNISEAKRQLDLECAKNHNLSEQIRVLSNRLKSVKDEYELAEGRVRLLSNQVDAMEVIDSSKMIQEMDEIEGKNRIIRDKIKYQELSKVVEDTDKEYSGFTDKIALFDVERKELISGSVDFGDTDITLFVPDPDKKSDNGKESDIMFEGKEFTLLSAGEKLLVSCILAFLEKPELRIIRIENGSLLDRISMNVIDKLAKKHGYQVLIEMTQFDAPRELEIVGYDPDMEVHQAK